MTACFNGDRALEYKTFPFCIVSVNVMKCLYMCLEMYNNQSCK